MGFLLALVIGGFLAWEMFGGDSSQTLSRQSKRDVLNSLKAVQFVPVWTDPTGDIIVKAWTEGPVTLYDYLNLAHQNGMSCWFGSIQDAQGVGLYVFVGMNQPTPYRITSGLWALNEQVQVPDWTLLAAANEPWPVDEQVPVVAAL